MSHYDRSRRQSLPDSAREAALDSAAATLAAIHMAKQAKAEATSQDASGGHPRMRPDMRLPVGDILYGVAQLQIDFARRLFEFNKEASRLLRDRARKNAHNHERETLRATCSHNTPAKLQFTIKNSSSLSKTFDIVAALDGVKAKVEIQQSDASFVPQSRVTLASESRSPKIQVSFADLEANDYAGDIEVRSNGITVERIPFEISVT